MGKLTVLRVARWARGASNSPEHPHIEALVEQEADKVSDGFHYARWIVPLVGLFFAVACFLPLALTVHPLFWIGSLGTTALGGILGAIFHVLASRISPPQLLLRKRCIALSNRMIGFSHLIGMSPSLSPKVAGLLDEAAEVYLATRQEPERSRWSRGSGVWAEATSNAERAMDEAMAQMLRLAEPETPQAQEMELSRGWAQPLLQEMKATAAALAQTSRAGAGASGSLNSPLADLADARIHLERLGSAAAELERDPVQEQVRTRSE
jgi:hypothetical protein